MANFQIYNFQPIISSSYYNGTQFTLFSDLAKTLPIDLSYCIIKMSLKLNYSLPTAAKTFTTEDGSILLTDAPGGKFNILGSNMNIPAGNYVYDIDILFPTGENKTYIKGNWIILPQVTN